MDETALSDAAPPAGAEEERDGLVRVLARGLAVLEAINEAGPVSMMQISRSVGIPYPTANRIVGTLMDAGLVEREPGGRRYRPTALVETLSSGYQEDAELVRRARPTMVALTQALHWPISLSTRVGSAMMLQDSTHQLTSLTLHDYAPGYRLPMVECASGKVYLAFAEQAERAMVIAGLGIQDGPAERMAKLLLANTQLLDQIRAAGYATHARNVYTATPGKTSSIAVPLFRRGKVAGALSLVFFAAAMPMREAEARYAGPLMQQAAALSALLDR